MKLPRAIRFFRKPDHISFLIALVFVIISNFILTFETKIISLIFFTFTIIYETYEILRFQFSHPILLNLHHLVAKISSPDPKLSVPIAES